MPEQDPDEQKKKPRFRIPLLPILILLAILLLFGSSFTSSGSDKIPYSKFRWLLSVGRITKIKISETEIDGEYIPENIPIRPVGRAGAPPVVKIGDDVIIKFKNGSTTTGRLLERDEKYITIIENIEEPHAKRVISAGEIKSITSAEQPTVGPFNVTTGNGSKTPVRKDRVDPLPAPGRGGCARSFTPKPKPTRVRFTTIRVDGDEEKLIEALQASGVEYEQEPKSEFLSILLMWIVPIGLIILFWIFLSRMGGGMGREVMSFGKSKAKIVAEKNIPTNFDDVAGCEEAKEELEEIVEYLKRPQKFQKLGGTIPKGVLLIGPPGTGKTLMARAIAGEAGVPFFSMSGSDFVEMFVGVGAARVRDLFNQAKERAPCIVFIDEMDAVGRHRGAGLGGGHDEREQTLNQLLVEMDGFESNKGVIIIAATNRPDILDPALLRPGRFDRQVILDTPDKVGRRAILEVHARGKPLADDADLDVIARQTPGFSGADLENALNEAALLAARKDHEVIEMEDLEEATERVMTGPERKSRIITGHEKKTIAVHELGHAITAQMLEHADPVHKVSIIPRGHGMGGYTLILPQEDKYLLTKSEILDRIKFSLGGRAAEEVFFDEISTGAANDLEKATNMARSMVCRFGMSERLGPIQYEDMEHNPFLGKMLTEQKSRFSEETLRAIDEEVRRIIDESYQAARKIVAEQKEFMEELLEILLEKETIEGPEFAKLVEERTGVKKYSVHFRDKDKKKSEEGESKKDVEIPEEKEEEDKEEDKEKEEAAPPEDKGDSTSDKDTQ
ncbi:MAG: ATP-dependent zinc metalloprotease FtsH [Planctomycetota bacterium]|nr:MAG: ATP-dependent zinc metalloprotease FtsH [Planctomycetota bacterium]